jgi:hypothetical protein
MSKLVSDPAIAEKYEEVRSDKSETNWSVVSIVLSLLIAVPILDCDKMLEVWRRCTRNSVAGQQEDAKKATCGKWNA